MTRPCDWTPLAEGDPLPGDPAEIAAEASRLWRLGEDMRAQVARLRRISADTTLVGAFAVELRAAAADLAKDLEQAAQRYEQVGSALRGWAPELAVAQDRTLQIRTRAIAADELRRQNAPLFVEPGWGQIVPSALVDPAAASRLAGQHEAEAMLAEARRALLVVLEEARARGRHYADLIDEANDILKDGRWDNFKDWADRNAEWIETYTDNLGWVATGLALAAIFVPGANVLLWSAIGITALSAGTHATLLATGNGSWTDLGLDAFALATFGAGAAAARGLKSAQLAARTAAASEARDTAVQAVLHAADNEVGAAVRVLGRPGTSPAARSAAQGRLDAINLRAAQEGAQAARQAMRQPLAGASRFEAFMVGDPGNAKAYNDVLRSATQYSNASGMEEAVRAGGRAYDAARLSYLSGTAADAYSKGDDVAAASGTLFRLVTGTSWIITPPPREQLA